ncbi:hypothetical protein [Rhodosalinus sp.]|uniref:hypothetical protein n=1 Tax=Rhodosalinus sp. TaxID=2047741 RepID=UPI00397D452C
MELPEYFFRVRENGALVFRIESGNRHRRLEMEPIAVANTSNGKIKPQGGRELTEADHAAIRAWMAEREAVLAARQLDDIRRTIDHLNLTAQWAQSRAGDSDLEAVTDDLLMAMHDLRTVLVRRKAERLAPKD